MLLTYVIISIYSNMFDTFILIVMLCPDSSTHCLQSLWIIPTVFAQDESLTAPGHIFRSSIQPTVSWFVVFHYILRFEPDDWIVGETPTYEYVFIFGMIF